MKTERLLFKLKMSYLHSTMAKVQLASSTVLSIEFERDKKLSIDEFATKNAICNIYLKQFPI